MALRIIGAGIGRTGTESLKTALEELGFGKCYHLWELMKNPEHLPEWEKLEAGTEPNYDLLFDGYASAVDLPSFLYYKEFLTRYPDAKVILTVRDADRWYESAAKTIFRSPPAFIFLLARLFGPFFKSARSFPQIYQYVKRVGHQQLFQDKIDDPEHCKAVFNSWNEEVRHTIPPDRLLVYEIKQGWEPLCAFLEVPVPDRPFPHTNKGESFQKRSTKRIFSSRR